MGREIGLPGFLIGVLTGSALSSLLLTYGRRHEGGDDCKSGNPPAESLEQRSPNPSRCPADHQDELSEEPTETRCFEGPLNDTDGRNHRRNDSESSSIGSLSRRSFALDDDDEASLSNLSRHNKLYAENPDTGTHVQIITPQEWATDEMLAQLSREFDEQILNKLRNREDVEMALRRTRAVNALAHALTVAKDETACFEVASRLLVPHFKIDVCAFLLLKDPKTIIVKHVTASKHEYASVDGAECPLKGSAAAICAKTLQQSYTPRTKESPYPWQKKVTYQIGLNTQLTTPIILNGEQFAGCIVACVGREDGFSDIDRMLVNNVAHMLGASIYSKRLRLAAESSNKISREMLHSMIPSKVIEKIECFWDESSSQYQNRRSSSFVTSQCNSVDDSERDFDFDDDLDIWDERTPPSRTQTQRQNEQKMERANIRRQSIQNKINLLNEMNRDEPADHVGVVIDTSAMELSSTHRALYAETVPNVCIIFTDIVNFSQISLDMKPIKVMDMLQNLFSRFDVLCDRFGIYKLETIGDAYICTTGMFDDDSVRSDPKAAANALAMAKEMVKEARRVLAPKKNKTIQTLEIRVGIHSGELTCGVLGERLPKFTVFGSSVNLAARMEQTCIPNRIRVTKNFFDLLPESEAEIVEAEEVITTKNMGEVETYLLNPFKEQDMRLPTHCDTNNGSRSLYD